MTTREDNGEVQVRLFKAIEGGDLEEVRQLLDADPSLSSSLNSEGASALIWAAYYTQAAIAEVLMDHGARPNVFEASALNLNNQLTERPRSDQTLVDGYRFDGWTPFILQPTSGAWWSSEPCYRMVQAIGPFPTTPTGTSLFSQRPRAARVTQRPSSWR